MATATTLRTRTPAAGSERSGPKTTRPSADKRTDLVLPAVAAKRCPHPTVYMLSDVGERDGAVGPYGKSLLYLVSNAFEGERATPILGMARFVSSVARADPGWHAPSCAVAERRRGTTLPLRGHNKTDNQHGRPQMTLQPKLRKPLLAAVLTAFAATSWAAYEYNSTLVPGPSAEAMTTTTTTTTTTVATPLALEPNETVVVVDERPAAPEASIAPAPVATPAVPVVERSEPSIEVTKQRLTPDQRIQADVMDLLARNPSLSGQIGVVSEDRTVTLTGWTATSGQAWRAGRDARGVQGVRHVVNEIRPRVGGITS